MTIQLSPEAEALIQQKVRGGLYANAEEAIDAALQLLAARDRQLERLRAAIAAGEEGEAIPWAPGLMDRIRQEADARQRRGELPDPDICQ